MQEAKIQQQAAEKEKILKTTQRQPAPGEELESRIGGGGKAVSSKAKSIKAAARSGATSVALTRSSKVRLFSYYCFQESKLNTSIHCLRFQPTGSGIGAAAASTSKTGEITTTSIALIPSLVSTLRSRSPPQITEQHNQQKQHHNQQQQQ